MKWFWTGILMFINVYGNCQITLEDNLRELKSIKSIKKIQPIGDFMECYEVFIEQPINHSKPEQGTFLQKVYFSHKNYKSPTVMVINGYISYGNIVNEWSKLLEANQIYVEHRYFGQSKPMDAEWENLNLRNACDDLHRIRMLLSNIYQSGWISTGISKGGLTAVSYKYFFPEDVDATIALSTSLKTSACDTSFSAYIDTLCKRNGCYSELKMFQRKLLSNKSLIIPLLEDYFSTRNLKHTLIDIDRIFEIAVLEIPFSIWQNKNGCETIMNLTAESPSEMLLAMRTALNDWFMTDDICRDMEAYHYQAQTELGYYCYPTSNFNNLLKGSSPVLSFIPTTELNSPSYSNQLMLDIKQWLTTSGNNIIYISGENDPYSIYKIQPDSNVNALSITLKNKNHNQVNYSNLTADQKEEVLEKIKNWIK